MHASRPDPQTLRLVVLDHSAQLSGAEINLTKVLPALEAARTTVVLAEDGDLVQALTERGIDTVVLPLDPRAGRITAQQRGIRSLVRGAVAFLTYSIRVARLLRRLRPQVVYTNSSKAHLYGAPAALLLRVPLVCHVHDRLTRDTYSPLALQALRFVFGHAAAGLIANSRSTAETLPGKVGSRTVSLPCPIEPRDVPPRTAAPGIRFAVVGRISPWKGQDLAVRAFARWAAGSTEAGSLTIAGGALFGEDDYGAALDDTIRRLGVADRVERTGHVAPERVLDVLDRTDVLLHTSLIPEPFGQVVIEGMQAGAVVIAAAAGGPMEAIVDGVDGLLYPMGDEDALVAAMARSAESPHLRATMGRAARETASRYLVETVVPDYQRFLASVARRGR